MKMTSPPSFGRRDRIDLVLHLLLVAALTAYCVFQCTAGTHATLPWNTSYYDMAAEGFRLGHLHLPTEPSAALLRLPDPYNYAHAGLWLWDTVLWNNHFYIYWGPVPAVCLLLVKLLGLYDGKVLDQWLVLIFMIGRLYAGSALIWSIAARPSRRVPIWTSLTAILLFAVAGPTPFMMARPVIYEACIASGQFFVFSGLLAAYWAVERGSLRLSVLAGVCWGLALNSRVTWLVVAPLLAACCAFAAYRRSSLMSGGARVRFARFAAAFALPVAASIGLAAAYNYARFGSVSDFGVAHQLTGRQFIPQLSFVLPNLYSFLLSELDWSCRFPFVQVSVHRILPTWIDWPSDYDVGAWAMGERASGMFVIAPIVWLAALLLLWPCQRVWRRRRRLPTLNNLSGIQTCMLVCGLCCVLSLLPALTSFTASMRYLEDPFGGAVLASYLVCFPHFCRGRARRRSVSAWIVPSLYAALALYSIGIGLCLGFSGVTNNFPRQNPQLYDELVRSLSVCDAK
jgi:hypothetical protein